MLSFSLYMLSLSFYSCHAVVVHVGDVGLFEVMRLCIFAGYNFKLEKVDFIHVKIFYNVMHCTTN